MVYESATVFPTPEGAQLTSPPPISTYGFQKLASEYFAKGALEQYGLPYTIVRPFNCVGIGERRAVRDTDVMSGNVKLALSHVVPDLVLKVLKGQDPLHILGEGNQVRHYTYGGDLARGIRLAMESPKAVNDDFNLSTAASTTVLELAELIWRKIHGPDKPFRYVSDPPFEHDVQLRVPDVRKAREVLGFEATTTLDAMLDEVIPWIRAGARGRAPVSESLDELYEASLQRPGGQRQGRDLARDRRVPLSAGSIRTQPVLDVACDRGYFIRWVQARERWATDIRDVRDELPPDVRFVQRLGLELESALPTAALRHDLHEQLPRAPRLERRRRRAAAGRRATAACRGSPDRAAAEHPARRPALLGLHRPPRRADGAQPRRGGRAGRPSNGQADPSLPAVLDEGPPAELARLVRAYLRFPPAWWLLGKQTLYVGTPEMTDGTPRPSLSIVLPVYNEGEAVEPVLRALADGVTTRHELVVVYDFDEDTTVPVVERLRAEIPGLRGLRNDLGRGVLNAMKAGIAGTTAPYVLISMADGSDEPHVVDPMVELARNGADVVAASRYMRGGRQIGGPPLKRLLSRAAGLTLALVRGCAHARLDEQLQALQPAIPRLRHRSRAPPASSSPWS